MIKCEHPIQLKTGLVVPCGKCLLCLSKRRDEWSHRLQLHSYGYDKMPLFVCVTYDNDHLPFSEETGSEMLRKRDLQLFIKRLKENFNLYNTNFTFFGCGERGDQYNRPHYHLLLFGFDELSNKFDADWLGAHEMLREQWKNGYVDIGRAMWSGVHYVTKYVLKYSGEDANDEVPPFLVASHGIGLPWLNTSEAIHLKYRLIDAALHFQPPKFYFNGDYSDFVDSCRDALQYCRENLPRLVAHTPQGFEVPIPRYLREKLVGHFEDRKDNVMYWQEMCNNVVESWDYLQNYADYDQKSSRSMADQWLDFAKKRIEKRIYLNSKQFKNETIRIGTCQKTCL